MFRGDEIDATVEGVEVELVPLDDPTHGSLTWRFVGRDAIDARAEFHNNGLGTITWTPAPASGKAAAHKDEGDLVTITAHAPVEVKGA